MVADFDHLSLNGDKDGGITDLGGIGDAAEPNADERMRWTVDPALGERANWKDSHSGVLGDHEYTNMAPVPVLRA